ncbi:MAG: SRPBCC domain-containing protein [Pedobacter sp.]|nr:MAG: SRPBCC domain-containing protein [Pedobacter sp.]
MTALNFTSTILVDQTPAEAFTAINNVRGWWQGEIEGNTEKLNEEFSYRMKDVHYSKQRIIESIPNEKVVWQVTDSELSSFKDKGEWTGTTIVFEISKVGDKTEIRFTHIGLVPTFECYGNCSWAWSQLIQESLFSFITTGKGVAIFG